MRRTAGLILTQAILTVLGGVVPVASLVPGSAEATAHYGVGRSAPAETSVTCDGVGAHTARLYRAILGRQGDREGLAYWAGLRRQGLSGSDVARLMMDGPEFQSRYGNLNDLAFVHELFRNLMDRPADPASHRYWTHQVLRHGRHAVVSWIVDSSELTRRFPVAPSSVCSRARALGLTEAGIGIHVGQVGDTVTVLADRSLVRLDAVSGPRTFASSVPADVVVNANWFTANSIVGPLVVDGVDTGGPDTTERGQIVDHHPDCPGGPAGLAHVWTWEQYRPGPCVRTAVSGVSLVHKGQRADAYPGIDLTTGYTNTNPAHSFIGFDHQVIAIVATRSMSASRLADYALGLGITEGIMLDGGYSTQIATPVAGLGTHRPVPAFVTLNSIG